MEIEGKYGIWKCAKPGGSHFRLERSPWALRVCLCEGTWTWNALAVVARGETESVMSIDGFLNWAHPYDAVSDCESTMEYIAKTWEAK